MSTGSGIKVNCWTCRAKTPHELEPVTRKWRCRGCGRPRDVSPEVISYAPVVELKPQAAPVKKFKRPRGYKIG